ncbi:MAG: hypothetical protein ABSD41_10240 [Candidatus Bathyarchaeia archaeon]
MPNSIRISTQKYDVKINSKVKKFIQQDINEPLRRQEAWDFINDLPNYPILQEGWDIAKMEGRDYMYRVRFGRYRIYYEIYSNIRLVKVTKAKLK